MSTYMDQADKAVDDHGEDRRTERMKQMMHHAKVSPYELRQDHSVSDGLNGNLRLKDTDFAATGLEPGDTVRVLVERADGDGQTIEFTDEIYSDGRGFNLPFEHRKQLNLEHGDAVHFWIERVEQPEPSDDIDSETTDETPEQRTLSGEPVMDEPYVLIEGGDFIYHHLEESGEQTRCGIDLGDEVDYRTFSDPGDVPLDECPDCMIRDSDNMTNEELARWIANELGFEIGGGPPSYFNKSQLVEFRDFILEANEAMERLEELTDGADDIEQDEDDS